MEVGQRDLRKNPRQSANLISMLTFGWSIPVFRRTNNKNLDSNDVFEPLDVDRSRTLGDRLERNWQVELSKQAKPSLARAVTKTFWFEITVVGVLCFLNYIVFRLMFPYLMENFLTHFRDSTSTGTSREALTSGTAIIVVTIISGISGMHYYFFGSYYGLKVCVAVSNLIYRKVLLLSQKSLREAASGKLINLLSNDLNRFATVFAYMHALWVSPVLVIICTCILWIEIQWAGMFGLAVFLIFVPIQSYSGKLSTKIRFETASLTDERVRLMNEIVSGVQVIKMYSWEEPFARLVELARQVEMKSIMKRGYAFGVQQIYGIFITKLAVFVAIIGTVLLSGRESLSVTKLFVIFNLFNFVSFATSTSFVRSLTEVGEAFVALKRLQTFLESEEKIEVNERSTECSVSAQELESENLAISMKNVCAQWSGKIVNGVRTHKKRKRSEKNNQNCEDGKSDLKPFTLRQFNLRLQKEKLVLVIGSVGSGKTTLMQVLLRELPLIGGSIGINGSVSYASQESWVFNSSVRQNITFGQPMDRSRYDEVIRCAALQKDFEQLSDGDATVVGENGIGLSGGQKARESDLARALYRRADIYLIDDPLSAVDAHVQSHIFNECIGPNGILAHQNATRILVTHQLHFLNKADWILVLKDGEIETQGTYDNILKSGIDVTGLLKINEENDEENADTKAERKPSIATDDYDESPNENETNDEEKPEEEEKMLKQLESSSKGKVKGSLTMHYFQSAERPFSFIFLVLCFLLSQILASFSDVWVAFWIRVEENRTPPLKVNESAYNQSLESQILSTESSNILTTEAYMNIYTAAVALMLVLAIVRSTFFFNICTTASQKLHDAMFRGLISTKMRFFDTNPSGRIMNRFSKDMGSTDDILPRTMLDALQTNLHLAGVIAITVYTKIEFLVLILIMSVAFHFLRKVFLRSSTNLKRLEATTKSPIFTHLSATLSGISTIRSSRTQSILKEEFEHLQDVNTGIWHVLFGMSGGFSMSLDLLVYIFITCVIYFFLLVTEGAEVTNNLVSVERILEYCQLKPEKQPKIPTKVSSDWPSQGRIEFRDVSYRYAPNLEPVLCGLSFLVKPGEKVSVVGRTGAGKSSLISSIFRLAEVDGEILIDDISTSTIDLNVLRSRISIIPQIPTLFSGTLRKNLDPFEEYSDDDVWKALEEVEMKEIVSESNGLAMPVLANGHNFSTGQRQILCLARAILRKNRIIILDEATANVDLRTDEMIQRTIREKFSNSTVITIAHRLHTVIDYDRVLVMDAGAAVEFDAPYALMRKERGIFKQMTQALGQQEYDQLLFIAKRNANSSEDL